MQKILTLTLFILFLLVLPHRVNAQELQEPPKQEFFKAEVISIDNEGEKEEFGFKSIFQDIKVQFLDGAEPGKIISMTNGGMVNITVSQKVAKGDTVILSKITNSGPEEKYFIADKYRLDTLPFLLIAFCILISLIAGKKGIGSLLGLIISLLVIFIWIVPNILHGRDPLFISITGSLVILFVTTYLAHGVSKQTTVALICTFFSLMVTAFLSIFMVNLTRLSGLGSEDAYSLQLGPATAGINLQGLLLGGIIIGTLGALNDITTTQSATIFEMAKDDARIKFSKLIKKGFLIGREHIVSLVNTLVLAYAGASLVVLIFFILNPAKHPYWVILNSETIFDEIVRTISGSVGLILAVPLVTVLAAWYVTRKSYLSSDKP